VEYSLFIMVVVLVMSERLERLEKRPGVIPTMFPLQSSLEQPLFLWFVFLHRLLARMLRGVFI
jgi:hypothetical protein